ncbi:MAG: phosphatase PAP2 family protein [Flavobacteriales bacterium]|nr:phosphatase PAP2 family protein [Flavobacteriales bacterium]
MKNSFVRFLQTPIFFLIALLIPLSQQAQQSGNVYELNWAIDAPVIAGAGALTGYGFSMISEQDPIDDETLAGLSVDGINRFDRSFAGNYSIKAEEHSDILFYGAFPYGLILLLDQEARSEAGTIGTMYVEALALAAAGYATAAGNTSRFRPYVYKFDEPDNQELQDDRRSLHARNSFYGGHPSMVAVSTVFVAKTFHDLNPDSDLRYALWGVAAASTLTTGYLRVQAGKHFPSDVITGVVISSSIGFLVPHLHKRDRKDTALQILPYTGEHTGILLSKRF